MRVDLFDFELPPSAIAHAPVTPRDSAKLLYVGNKLQDLIVSNLVDLLKPGDVLVMNDSRVIPARLFTEIGGRKIEVLLHQSRVIASDKGERGNPEGRAASAASWIVTSASPPRNDGNDWLAFAKPARKLKPGMALTFAPGFEATVTGRTEDGQVMLNFPYDSKTLFEKLRAHGHVPLPPYITREDQAEDRERYQTVYADREGSVAAPTAGLHFTPSLLEALKQRGVSLVYVTLHVGAGTFQPVKVEDTTAHVMHRETIEISEDAATTINRARAAGGNVIAVGTTSLRILESVAAEDGTLRAFSGDTGIFITPGYRFKVVDRLMTNFHLPKSTLFMLVSAFAGRERMLAAYEHAIKNNYRFYSYGDASLLERA